MKLLTLWQPWASLMACGLKQWETRPRRINFRGRVAIHAAKVTDHLDQLRPILDRMDIGAVAQLAPLIPLPMPLGAIVAVGDVVDVVPTHNAEPTQTEEAAGDYSTGRWVWKFERVRALSEPLPFRGYQAMIELPADVLCEIEARL